jgi:hypothetical protein
MFMAFESRLNQSLTLVYLSGSSRSDSDQDMLLSGADPKFGVFREFEPHAPID